MHGITGTAVLKLENNNLVIPYKIRVFGILQ
jgi:hypothetical protein